MDIIPRELIKARILDSKLPYDGADYVFQCYDSDPKLFTKWFNTAESNAKREGVGLEQYSLWIAANCVYTINSKPPIFNCYYCNIDFLINASEVEFEHFIPKLQQPGNIVFSCTKCNFLKKDHTLDYYEKYLNNNILMKGLQLKNKHFIPLVLRHYGGLRWVKLMREFALNDFKIKLSDNENRYSIFERYAEMFRNEYYKK